MELRYKKFCREHFDLWDKHLLSNSNVMKFVYSYETGLKKMPYYLEHWDKYGFGWYSIFSGNNFVGRVGLFWNNFQPSRVELGYTIREEYWGKGIATAASAFVINHFFNLKIATEIVATIEDENLPSIRVAQKLGFKQVEGADVFIEGNSHPLRLYRLVSDI